MRRLWATVRRHHAPGAARRGAPRPAADPAANDRLKARQLADAIDRAMALGSVGPRRPARPKSATRLVRCNRRGSANASPGSASRGATPTPRSPSSTAAPNAPRPSGSSATPASSTLGRGPTKPTPTCSHWAQKSDRAARRPHHARHARMARGRRPRRPKLALLQKSAATSKIPRTLEWLVLHRRRERDRPSRPSAGPPRLRDCSAFGAGSSHPGRHALLAGADVKARIPPASRRTPRSKRSPWSCSPPSRSSPRWSRPRRWRSAGRDDRTAVPRDRARPGRTRPAGPGHRSPRPARPISWATAPAPAGGPSAGWSTESRCPPSLDHAAPPDRRR
jgi:hypothetical protein